MTAAIRRRLLVFLRRAGILTGMLALIAGIFGMHILSGAHDLHATTASPAAGTQLNRYVAEVGEKVPGHRPAVAAASYTEVISPCLNPATCPTMATTTQKCIPAPANTSFEAPGPGTGLPASRVAAPAGPNLCQALPTPGPSPISLGISRT